MLNARVVVDESTDPAVVVRPVFGRPDERRLGAELSGALDLLEQAATAHRASLERTAQLDEIAHLFDRHAERCTDELRRRADDAEARTRAAEGRVVEAELRAARLSDDLAYLREQIRLRFSL